MEAPAVARAKALWDFQPGAPTDLPLRAGQIIKVTRKVDPNWWEGEADGRIGIFPVQYVEELPLEATPSLPPRPSYAGVYSFIVQPASPHFQKQAIKPPLLRNNPPHPRVWLARNR